MRVHLRDRAVRLFILYKSGGFFLYFRKDDVKYMGMGNRNGGRAVFYR